MGNRGLNVEGIGGGVVLTDHGEDFTLIGCLNNFLGCLELIKECVRDEAPPNCAAEALTDVTGRANAMSVIAIVDRSAIRVKFFIALFSLEAHLPKISTVNNEDHQHIIRPS